MREKEGLNQTLRITSEIEGEDREFKSESEDGAMSLKVINHYMIGRSSQLTYDTSLGHSVLTKA